jgi:hypothetical protein
MPNCSRRNCIPLASNSRAKGELVQVLCGLWGLQRDSTGSVLGGLFQALDIILDALVGGILERLHDPVKRVQGPQPLHRNFRQHEREYHQENQHNHRTEEFNHGQFPSFPAGAVFNANAAL